MYKQRGRLSITNQSGPSQKVRGHTVNKKTLAVIIGAAPIYVIVAIILLKHPELLKPLTE